MTSFFLRLNAIKFTAYRVFSFNAHRQLFLSTFRPLRTSLGSLIQNHLVDYPTPLSLTYFWGFGSVAGLLLAVQIVTGLFLTFHYAASTQLAFDVMEHIMRDVNYGWLLRFTHCNGASFFFLVVYAHIGRAFYYGSFLFPRYHLWASGVLIFLLMMATAFMGYVLPWGQMSFWGATVITNLFSAIPFIGDDIATWLWGGFSVDNPTLNRFFGFHFIVPFAIAGVVGLHLLLLHSSGSSDPVVGSYYQDRLPFYPYFYTKDLVGLLITFILFSFFVFFTPDSLGHPDNYIEGNALVTPAHIVPEWYFLPFYAMLRAVPDKLGGVICMITAILVLLAIPASFQPAPLIHPAYDNFWSVMVGFFFSTFLTLGWLGAQSVEVVYVLLGQVLTLCYFSTLLFGFAGLSLLSWCILTSSSKVYNNTSKQEDDTLLLSRLKVSSSMMTPVPIGLYFLPWPYSEIICFDFLVFSFVICKLIFFIWGRVNRFLARINFKVKFYKFLQYYFFKLKFASENIFFDRQPLLFFLIFLSVFLWFVLWEVKNLVLYFIVLELLGIIPIIFIVLGQRRPSLFSYETAIKYLLLNVLTAFLFLFSVIILYALTKSLDLGIISRCIQFASATNNSNDMYLFSAAFILFLAPFFFKLGLAPFHWLIHDIYKVMPLSFFSFYASFYKFFAAVTIFQIAYFIFYPVLFITSPYFLFSALLTTVICLVAVISSSSFRPIFGYLSASNASLLLLSFLTVGQNDLGFFLTSASYFLSGNAVYCLGLFFLFASLKFLSKELSVKIYYISDSAKLQWIPGVRLYFFILFFILSGLPPTAVFWFKFSILEILSSNFYYSFIAFFFLIAQFVFLFTYFRITKAALFDRSQCSQNGTTERLQNFSFQYGKSTQNFLFTRLLNNFTRVLGIKATVLLILSLFCFDFLSYSSNSLIQFLSMAWNMF